MTTFSSRSAARRWRCLPLAVALCASFAASAAETVAGQFAEWSGSRPLERQISLRELGFAQPLVLAGRDDRRELYLPVPAGVPTRGAELQLEARYLRGHPGRSALQLAVDGDPVAVRAIADEQGDAGQLVGIDGLPRDSGFVRVGIGWWSMVSDDRCADQNAPANTLRVSPDSRFRYSVDGAAIDTVAKAWGALPGQVRVLVAGRGLAAPAYDAAWRVGAVIEKAGRQVSIVALPAVGDTIAVPALDVPASLRGIPAYAALSSAGAHRIAGPAELGALLSLGAAGPLAADVVIADDALRTAVAQALDALAAEVATAGPEATAAFARWRAAGMSAFAAGDGDLSVAQLGGGPVLVVAAAAGTRAAGLLDAQWRAYAVGRSLRIASAGPVRPEQGRILLDRFGPMSGSVDVAVRADRSVAFDLGAIADGAGLPEELVLDLAGAPDAAGDGVVVSVFLNDVLLGARVLDRNARAERVRVPVPRHALAGRNEVRVSFLRQPTRQHCHDPVTAYPVTVLPGSHIRLGRGRVDGFAAAAVQLSGPYQLRLPASWLADAPVSLSKVIRVANAVGASPLQAELAVGAGDAAGASLSFLEAAEGGADAARLTLAADGRTVLDLAGLQDAAVVEVVEQGGHTGVRYREFGEPRIVSPLRLVRGSVALLDARGVVQDYDARDPSGARLAQGADPTPAAQRHMVWLVALVVVIALMLLAARVAQVRRRRAGREH